jgi:uncharacterized protein
MSSLGNPRYVRFTNFRKNGTPVSTPVWFAPMGDEWVFSTAPEAGKVKRLRNNPAVEITASDVRGKVKDDAVTFPGTARLLEGDAERDAERAMSKKYGLQWKLLRGSEKLRNMVGVKADPAYICVTLD